MTIPSTYPITPPRADLNQLDFNQLIYQKGRTVIFERVLSCPCKGKSSNHLSNCKNCGGFGWIWVNPIETRMLITGVSVVNEVKPWSEESRGMINLSCNEEMSLTFMDRVTLTDGKSIHSEALSIFKKGSRYFAWSDYPIKELIYGGLFIDADTPLQQFTADALILGPKNLVEIDTDVLPLTSADESVTLRYYHNPVYYVVDMKRETMQTFKYESGNEIIQNMPLSAIARRAHYVFTDANLTSGVMLLDNDYTE